MLLSVRYCLPAREDFLFAPGNRLKGFGVAALMVGLTVHCDLFLIWRNSNGTTVTPHSKLDGFDLRLHCLRRLHFLHQWLAFSFMDGSF